MATFVKYNANPWGKSIGDCAIRACSVGLNKTYEQVCKDLKVSWKKGHGLIRDTGIDLYDIQKVYKDYFGNVENYDSTSNRPKEFDDFKDPFLDDDEFDSPEKMETLRDWMIEYKGTGPYLVGLCDKFGGSGHIVYVATNQNKFYDTWDCSKMRVDSFMSIKKIDDDGQLKKKYK